MPRRVVRKPVHEDEQVNGGPPPAAPLDLAVPGDSASGSSLGRVVARVYRIDPDALDAELEAAEQLPQRTFSVVLEALDQAFSLSIKAAKMAATVSAAAARYREFEQGAREAEIRSRALDKMPRETTADGKREKAPTKQQIEDYLMANHAEELQAVRGEAIKLAEAAAYWERKADLWKYRPRALEVMLESLRLGGDYRTERD